VFFMDDAEFLDSLEKGDYSPPEAILSYVDAARLVSLAGRSAEAFLAGQAYVFPWSVFQALLQDARGAASAKKRTFWVIRHGNDYVIAVSKTSWTSVRDDGRPKYKRYRSLAAAQIDRDAIESWILAKREYFPQVAKLVIEEHTITEVDAVYVCSQPLEYG
jgi:hypothetical protein